MGSSSSSSDQRVIQDLVHEKDNVRALYSDATCEVGRLQLYLEAVQVALSALERETTATRGTVALMPRPK